MGAAAGPSEWALSPVEAGPVLGLGLARFPSAACQQTGVGCRMHQTGPSQLRAALGGRSATTWRTCRHVRDTQCSSVHPLSGLFFANQNIQEKKSSNVADG